MIALAWLTVFALNGLAVPDNFFLVWLISYGIYNALLLIGVRYRHIPSHLPVLGVVGDVTFLSILPLLPGVNNPFLILFTVFPTLVAAMRFGVGAGLLTAVVSLLPYELAFLAAVLPPELDRLLPIPLPVGPNLFTAFFPVVALFGAVVLVGYLAQREREAAVGAAAAELDELRQAIASARLFYESTDTLSSSVNYNEILGVMLQAGVIGMPHARGDDKSAVGIALLFEESAGEDGVRQLQVSASRRLDHSDLHRRVPGKEGVIAQALETGEAVPFTRAASDPELAQFSSLRRMRTGIVYPLQSGLDVYGVVVLATPSSAVVSEQHLRLMRAFINQAAVAFQNAQLYENLRHERDHIIEAESSARARLARDLHDGPTQSMAALAMRLDFIRLLLERDPEQAKAELEQAREAVMRVGKDLRGLLFTLRPLSLENQGLSAALVQYAQRLRENDNISIDLQQGHFGKDLDPNIAATVFAVIEEAVSNARKHAPGSPIHVSLDQENGSLLAMVRDQGPGFDVNAVMQTYSARGSLGMVNMRDRARLVQGQLSVDSAPGRGTRIFLSVPLNAARARTADTPNTN
jgi:signal transduction histidine kinase